MGRLLQLPLLLASCGWEPPLDTEPVGNGITGSVVFSGPGAPSTTFVTLFRADDPGPPLGTGSPITFTAVGARTFTGGGQGLEAGRFAFTDVPDGDYYVNALMDHDGDFNPFGLALAGATCGDVVGSHLRDLTNLEPVPVRVRGGELLEDVTVLLGGPLPTERPTFMAPDDVMVSRTQLAASIDASGNVVPENIQRLTLEAVGVRAAYSRDLLLDLPGPCEVDADCTGLAACPCEAETSCDTALPVWLVDRDADGTVDPYPAELQASRGLLDVWPRVYLEHLGEPVTDPDTGVTAFQSELGTFRHDGEQRPERWVTEAFPMAAELQGALEQDLPLDAVAGGPIGVPFQAQSLSLTISPVFRHYHADGRDGVDVGGPFDVVSLSDPGTSAEIVPAGVWSITVVGPSGQTWTVPNELGLLDLPAPVDGAPLETQAQGLRFE